MKMELEDNGMRGQLSRVLFALIIASLSLISSPARADTAAALEALKRPGVNAIMRHAIAPGTGDPAAFRLDDCKTQRNLDSRGRSQARVIGQALRDAGIVFDQVLTSQWCRCRETAVLVDLGTPMDFPALNSFFRDRSSADEQTAEVRAFLGSLPESERVLLVTHQVNITALTGRGIASGEIFLIENNEAGKIEVVGDFLIRP
jgi:phosphohistidine phosphatase SixA